MTWIVPAALEDAVYSAARSVLGDPPLATAALTRAIVDRSKRYTSERERLAAPVNPRADLAARAAFFTIADAIKIAIPIGELAGRNALPARDPLRIVDLGAGCGAISLGAIASIERALEIVAIDRDPEALKIAGLALADFAKRSNRTVTVTTRTDDIAATRLPTADLVVLGTVLNELPVTARLPLVQRALAAIAPDGAVIIIEPALRETSRALHELRDAVLAGNHGFVFAPCTRTCAPCPALLDPADWCHEDRLVQLPPRTAELARLTHLRDSGLKLAYLVLRRSPLPLVESPGAWRVVSAPMPAKGKLEIYGCSDAGRLPIRLLRRHRSDANRAFERTRRGDVLVTDAVAGDERVELDRDTTLERIEPARR